MSEEKKTDGKASHADTIVRNHVIWSMGAGMIPVLVADIFAVSAIQLDMIRQMSKVYDVEFNELQGKAIVTALTSSTLARVAAGSVVKLIPGLGSIIGGVTVSVFAGASTYALGEVFKRHFDSGGTILDFDPDRVKKLYKEKFEKGKKVAQEWREQQKEKNAEPEPKPEPGFKTTATSNADNVKDPITQLKELGDLKSAGVITEEEFEIMKKKIING
ncbi:MAG: DUF697 domain-containing protein [Saprospiraceae bacterium]|nr:DUF697 domain-containing protein [Saprospiraceae bacterium]